MKNDHYVFFSAEKYIEKFEPDFVEKEKKNKIHQHVPLTPTLFSDECDFAVAFVLFAFDSDSVAIASACPFSAISFALRFLAGNADILHRYLYASLPLQSQN